MSWSRRRVLRGMLGGSAVALGLPVLEAGLDMGVAAHAATHNGLPLCFAMYYWANGMLPDRFEPLGEGADWQLSDELMPLERHKSKVAVVSGLAVTQPNLLPHDTGLAGFLSGSAPDGVIGDYTFAGPSLDQVIAAEIGNDTRFRSMETGIKSANGYSFLGPNQRLPTEESPFALFQRMFGTGFTLPGEDPIIDPTWALRRSVLDAVLEDAARLQTRLGAVDRARIEAHMDGVRDLELQLARLELAPPDLAACALPEVPPESFPEVDGRPQLAELSAAFSKLMAMGLACDQTRVISQWFEHPGANPLHPGANDGHHNLTHDEPDPQDGVHDITIRCIENMAVLLDELNAIEEVDGSTLLDRCAVLGFSEVSLGRTHALDRFPFILAGGAGGRLATDQHIIAPTGTSTTVAQMSLFQALGVSRPSFGTGDAFTESRLDALLSA